MNDEIQEIIDVLKEVSTNLRNHEIVFPIAIDECVEKLEALSNNKDTSTKIISKQQGIIDELVEDNEKLQYSLQRVGKEDSEVLDWIDENMGEFEDLIWNDGIEITGNIRELINKAGGSDDNSKNKRR
jgi:hypothetical protein